MHLLLAVSLAAAQPGQALPLDAKVTAGETVHLDEDSTPASAAAEIHDKPFGSEVVRNVSHSTLTAFLPDPGLANGSAVIVVPGGGFMMLSMESEGFAVARALAAKGLAAFVLKYRLRETPKTEAAARAFISRGLVEKVSSRQLSLAYLPASDDTAKALSYVRANAERLGIKSDRIGILGFSAGAVAALDVVAKAEPAQEPSFIGYIYGPQEQITVPKSAPPMFAAIAFDDPLIPLNGFDIELAWRNMRVPVELHVYQRGGHGFGLGYHGTTTTLLLDEFTAWLDMQGFLRKDRK